MSEFLKEYHLFDDMSRLNHELYFGETFTVTQVDEFLGSLKTEQDMRGNEKTLRIFLVNFRRASEKSVYVHLKWMVCLHRALENMTNELLLEKIYDNLSKVELPEVKEAIEEFIKESIIQPYIHFLAKLCIIKMQEASHNGEKQPTFNKENYCSDNNSKSNLKFIKFNLLRHSVGELVPTTADLHNYFRMFYPLLATISPLLHRNLKNLLREIRGEAKIQCRIVSQEQLFRIESQIDKISSNECSQSSFQAEAGCLNEKLSFLMQSGQKEEKEEEEKDLSQFYSFD